MRRKKKESRRGEREEVLFLHLFLILPPSAQHLITIISTYKETGENGERESNNR